MYDYVYTLLLIIVINVHENLLNNIAEQSYNIFHAACTALARGLCGNYKHLLRSW